MSAGIDRELGRFSKVVRETRVWLGATEILWLGAPTGSSTRQQLGPSQLEALHEAAFLRIFGAWEAFQEEALVRFMAGHVTSSYPTAIAAQGTTLENSIAGARAKLHGGRPYLLWHNPDSAIKRSQKYIDNSPVEAVLTAHQQRIDHIAAVRHRIAHTSDDAKAKFIVASAALAGVTYDGIAGRLLRATNTADGLNLRMWTYELSENLLTFAYDIAS